MGGSPIVLPLLFGQDKYSRFWEDLQGNMNDSRKDKIFAVNAVNKERKYEIYCGN